MTQQFDDILTIGGLALFGIGIAWVLPRLKLHATAVTAGTKPPVAPKTNTPAPATKGTSTAAANSPARLGYKATGQKVAMQKGSNHRNGQRFNVNHKFKNYVMIGFFKIGSGQEAINHKTDGPNHGSCTSLPKCVWVEPNLNIASGKLDMTSEWPHPKNHNGMPCPSCKSIGAIKAGQWLGWAVAAFDVGGFRKIEAWADKSGTGASWTKIASEVDKGQITNSTLAKRSLFLSGAGLESEIRMHGAKSGDTSMRDCNVWEIVPPATATAGFVEAYLGRGILSILEAPIPRSYNVQSY